MADDQHITSSNRQAWNEAAADYVRDADQWVARLRAGEKHFCPPELKYLEGLSAWCHRAIHLQCAGGTDSLSLLNLGAAEVVGIDLSDKMIEVARYKAAQLGARAEFIQCSVYDTPAALDGTADLVYTGRGALNWLMDLPRWAATVARLLKPGGRLYVFEGHPMTCFFKMDAERLVLDPEFKGYHSTEPYVSKGWPTSYITQQAPTAEQSTKFERYWQLCDYVQAVLGAGLVLKALEEHPTPYWKEFPNLQVEESAKIPHTFSLLAFKPA